MVKVELISKTILRIKKPVHQALNPYHEMMGTNLQLFIDWTDPRIIFQSENLSRSDNVESS